jgi:hypothetical protein
MGVDLMARERIKPTADQLEKGGGFVWCLALGFSTRPKALFYAHTIREAFLKANRAAKKQTLGQHTPWGEQPFTPTVRRRAKVRRGESPRKKRKPE